MSLQKVNVLNSPYFGLGFEEARRGAPTQMVPCRSFRLGGQKSQSEALAASVERMEGTQLDGRQQLDFAEQALALHVPRDLQG